MTTYAQQKGTLLVITSPLGVGKQTLCHAVLDRQPTVRLAVSYTTRAPLSREVNGFDYLFISMEEFGKKVKERFFLEWTKIHGHCYGVPKASVLQDLNAGLDVILNVDTAGSRAVKKTLPEAVQVFITLSSWEAFEARFRGQMGADITPDLLKSARDEIRAAHTHDYVVINDNLMQAAEDIVAILRSERRRAGRALKDISRLLDPPVPPA